MGNIVVEGWGMHAQYSILGVPDLQSALASAMVMMRAMAMAMAMMMLVTMMVDDGLWLVVDG